MAAMLRGVRGNRVVLAVALGWMLSSPASPAHADEPGLPAGRWSVASRGFGWPCRLTALEVRPTGRGGEATLLAFESDEVGGERPWGTARLDRKGAGPSAARWFSATWATTSSTFQVQLRPEGAGRLLALVRERPGDRAAGERVRQVVLVPAAAADEARPVVDRVGGGRSTPGSSLIRFEAETSGAARAELSGVFVAGRDGEGARPVALPDGFARAASPCWSPDGRWLAFAGFDAAGRDPLIRVASASGGPSTAVAAGICPTWSHDGRRIAYVASGRQGYATDWSTPGRNDERVEVVTLAGPRAGEVEVLARGIWPRWSPTDDRLAFVGRRDANWDVYLRSADGLSLARLTDDPALDTQPCWLADGRSLIFLSDRGNRWDLYRVAVAAADRDEARSPAIRLSDHAKREDNPSISPDGRHVAFVDGRARPESSILILDLDRGTVRPFPSHPDGDRDPAWSPDGRSIAFVSRRPGPLLSSAGERP